MKRIFAALLAALLFAAGSAFGQVYTNPYLTGVDTGSSMIGMPVIGGTANQLLYIDASGNLAGSSALTWNGTTLTTTGLLTLPAGAVGAPTVRFGVDTTSGFYQPSADTLAASISGVQRWLLNSSGATVTGALSVTDASTTRTNLGLSALTSPLTDYGGRKFDGASDYLDGNALTGIADGQKATYVAVVRFANAASATEELLSNTGARFRVSRTATGNISVNGTNAAGTAILGQSYTGTPAAAAGTYVIMVSFDLSAGSSATRIYVNDVTGTISSPTFTNDTLDYTVAEWSIGATTIGGTKFTGDMYLVYFDATTNLDFSSVAVRRRFVDANGVPQFLGRSCQLPSGSTPILCLAYDPYTQWPINRGSSTTTFVENGTPAAPTTALNGQFVPREAVGVVKTVTADYTVGTTDKTIINNRAATNTLTLPAASTCRYCTLRIVTIQAQTVVSASSNVAPRVGGAAGTAILAATDGAWADIESDGSTWIITAGNP